MTDSTPQTVEEHADAIVAAAGDLLRHQAINKVADFWSKNATPIRHPRDDEFVAGQVHAILLAFGVGTPETIYSEIIAAQSRCHRLEGSVAA